MTNVSIIGRLTTDPQTITTKEGETSFLKFSIAFTGFKRDKNGEKLTSYINCIVLNKNIVEPFQKYVKKGILINVNGELFTRIFENKDNMIRKEIQLLVNSFEILEPKKVKENEEN